MSRISFLWITFLDFANFYSPRSNDRRSFIPYTLSIIPPSNFIFFPKIGPISGSWCEAVELSACLGIAAECSGRYDSSFDSLFRSQVIERCGHVLKNESRCVVIECSPGSRVIGWAPSTKRGNLRPDPHWAPDSQSNRRTFPRNSVGSTG